ncbi:MAG: T9SS type A sorting domain-containing protein, partial [Bacteroidales bacterium]|nr:T9SS type A sorting domain-containing protein [Bacteroidales bacterium]
TLPVELISFVAVENEGVVNLTWVTASEINNSHFEVLRSYDAVNFEVIGLVEGHGTSNIIRQYSSQDNPANSGMVYYRLRQIDFDGRFEFSEIISVSISANGELSVFPNPANSSDLINVNMSVEDDYEFSIYNLQGKLVKNEKFRGNQIQISAAEFAPGIYLIRVKDSVGHLNISKFLVQE